MTPTKALKVPFVMVLLGIATFFQTPAVYGHSGDVLSAFSQSRPLIDGVVSADEWDDAAVVTFLRTLGSESQEFTLFVKNDNIFLYVAVVIEDVDVNVFDSLTVEFDNDHDGIAENGDDRWRVSPFFGFETQDGFLSGGSVRRDTSDGGTSELTPRVTHSEGAGTGRGTGVLGTYTFEVRHPLDSGDVNHDIALTVGSTVGFRVVFRDASKGRAAFPELAFADLVIADGPVIDVPPPQVISVPRDFPTIGEAIRAANPGDTISIRSGTYTEELSVDIPLIIEGRGRPILISGEDPVALNHTNIFISAENVEIRGLELRADESLIRLFSSNGVVIEDNQMFGGFAGYGSLSADSSKNITLQNNIISETDNLAVLLTEVSNSAVIGNRVFDGGRFGVILSNSRSSTVVRNEINEHGATALVFRLNSRDNVVVGNTLVNNGVGIVMSSSSNNILHHNGIIENGVQFLGSRLNTWDDGAGEGNFWSDYEGEDLNRDGVGDTLLPHQGVDFFPLIKRPRKPL